MIILNENLFIKSQLKSYGLKFYKNLLGRERVDSEKIKDYDFKIKKMDKIIEEKFGCPYVSHSEKFLTRNQQFVSRVHFYHKK